MLDITLLIISITSLFLSLGSYLDLKSGEIPDRISIGLVIILLFFSGLYSLIELNINPFASSLILGALYFLIGYALFYLGQWGGGDVKLLTGIGCSLGFLGNFYLFPNTRLPVFISYFINMGFIALPYTILYSLILSIRNPRVFREFRNYIMERNSLLLFSISIIPFITAQILGLKFLSILYLLFPLLVLISVYLKAVEDVALKRKISVERLQEGDVLAMDLVVDGRKIAKKSNISGLEQAQIQKIRELSEHGKIPSELWIRYGIRFAPILFLAFLITVFYGSILETFLSVLNPDGIIIT